jgi:UDP-glucose 4-epimerase
MDLRGGERGKKSEPEQFLKMPANYYLFTGAAGYVGSHVLRFFIERGEHCVVLDNLSKGHREAVPEKTPFFQADISDTDQLAHIFNTYPVSGILHFAGYIEVGESVKDPGKYFENNVSRAVPFLEAVRKFQIPWVLFSSSAAVYGEPEKIPILENDSLKPTSPYGLTKLMMENMLQVYEKSFGIRSVCLRYFNAAGACPSGGLGESHTPESHLIPRACKAAINGVPFLSIYGTDYQTPDGTCIRDYVHIWDLAEAHYLSAKALDRGMNSTVYNIGSEKGYSVKEVLKTLEVISNRKIPIQIEERRAGDPAVLVASSKRIRQELGWDPKYQSLEKILVSAYQWHETHPDGFAKSLKNH